MPAHADVSAETSPRHVPMGNGAIDHKASPEVIEGLSPVEEERSALNQRIASGLSRRPSMIPFGTIVGIAMVSMIQPYMA